MTSEPVQDAAFLTLKLPSYVGVDPSPPMKLTERGLRIAAPRRVVASPLMRVPLCATANVDQSEVPFSGSLWDAVVAIAVDVRSNRAWAQPLADPNLVGAEPLGAEPESSPPPASGTPTPKDAPPDENAGRIPPDAPMVSLDPGMVEYGNFDLVPMLGLPPTPASYWIHLTLGSLQSNAVRVDVVSEIEEE